MLRTCVFLALMVTALTACATIPAAPSPGCSIAAYPLARAAGGLRAQQAHLTSGSGEPTVSTLTDLLATHTPVTAHAGPSVRHVLLLSGGSQHGAFGGGFLLGLKQANNFRDYDVVTGISTGAIQSTFAFLGNADEPAGRTYPSFMLRSKAFGGVRQSNLTDLAIAYLIDRESDLIQERRLGYVGMALSGSLETFEPMRKLALGLISPATLNAIADHGESRLLLVGVTNLTDGTTYALDLTALARDAAHNDADRECFVDAILASAAVPPGISPIPLTTHLVYIDAQSRKTVGPDETSSFIDGGSRYAVFFDQLQSIRDADGSRPVDIDVIVNGVLHLGKWTDPVTQEDVTRYSVIDVIERASDVLESQARETSVQSAENASNGGQFRIAYMPTDESDNYLYPSSSVPSKIKPMTCNDWARYDKSHFHPLEFYPDYMRCILDYGAWRGRNGAWTHVK